MPGEDGFDETRGWDRASIAFRSRKPYVPDVSREDLLLPNEAGKLRTLALCSICAFGLTILFVGFPLLALGIFAPLGLWYPASLAGAFFGLAVLLFLRPTRPGSSGGSPTSADGPFQGGRARVPAAWAGPVCGNVTRAQPSRGLELAGRVGAPKRL